jgi:PAS domain S-box-containing protein
MNTPTPIHTLPQTFQSKGSEELPMQTRKVNIIIESMTDPFFVLGKDLEVLLINKAALKLAKLEYDEIIGKDFHNINLSEDRKPMFDLFKKAIREQKTYHEEFEIQGKWVEISLYPSEIGLAVYAKDISEKKEHEESIISNSKFIKEISDSTAGFIFQLEYDIKGIPKLNYASKKAFDYWGIPIAEVMEDSTKLFASIYEEDIEYVSSKLMEMVTDLFHLNIKFRYLNNITDEIKRVKAVAVPTRLSNGNTIVNGIVIDITEIENNYIKLEDANRRYEYLSKATLETIWEKDIEAGEIILGGGYKEMFGCEFLNDKISFNDWKKFIHPEDLSRMLNYIDVRSIDPSETYWEFAYRFIQKNGKILEVFERAYVVFDDKSNKLVKIIGTTQDITPLGIAQVEKDKMIDDLLRRNKAMEQFTYIVSHNLRAPIANIIGISTILEDKTLDEDTKQEMNDHIKKSAVHLDGVIRDMNEILNIKNNLDESKNEVIFKNILGEIIETEKIPIYKAQLKILSNFEKSPSIYSVKSFIHSIFLNMITNSIKYKKESGAYIKIISDEDADYIYLVFEDNGIGIDMKKNQGEIFGLYKRFHLEKEGKGMGLFMVKSQVESLNGEISVQSEVNSGTKFLIKFKK